MSIFDGILGNWIQIIDDQNEKSIENYGYNTGVIEGTTGNHCVKCVAINKCWFKNEKDKKPERFDLTKIDIVDSISKGLDPGLYHFRCHCKEVPIFPYSVEQIELIIPYGKFGWLVKDKSDWINSMGYHDILEFYNLLLQKTKQAYFYGNYYIENHTNYGCKINLKVDIPGINEKNGKVYKLESNYMIFPNGKLKCNTLLGGWQKWNI